MIAGSVNREDPTEFTISRLEPENTYTVNVVAVSSGPESETTYSEPTGVNATTSKCNK